jgi:DnaK suppressor protein
MSASKSSAGLSPTQLATLRALLIAERSRLEQRSRGSSPVRQPGERTGDAMDQAEEDLEQHDAIVLDDHDRTRLADVELALLKMDEGTYGVSELSEEPIGYARLHAVPWARLTAAEQEERERRSRR